MARRKHRGHRKSIHITPRKRGEWAVKVEGNKRASKTYSKKSTARNKGRKKAKKLADRHGKSELVIHRKDGSIQDKRNYGGKTKW